MSRCKAGAQNVSGYLSKRSSVGCSETMRGFVLPRGSNLAGGLLAACSKLRGGTPWYVWHPATNSSVSTRKGKKQREGERSDRR